MHFVTGDEWQVAKAITEGTKINTLTNDESLIVVFMYVFALIGLKTEQMPNKTETIVLVNFVKSNYGAFRVEEIKVAFELGIKKQYQVDMNHYGNFSPLYFGNIMNAYKESRNKVGLELNRIEQKKQSLIQKEVTDSELLKTNQEFTENVINPIFNEYKKTGILDFGITSPKIVYNTLIFENKDYFSLEDKKQIKIEAIENIKKQTVETENQKSINKEDFAKKKAFLDLVGVPAQVENLVKNECYKIAVKQIFNKIKTL